jgi:hypothetical protein
MTLAVFLGSEERRAQRHNMAVEFNVLEMIEPINRDIGVLSVASTTGVAARSFRLGVERAAERAARLVPFDGQKLRFGEAAMNEDDGLAARRRGAAAACGRR